MGNYVTLTINAGALKYISQDAWYEVYVYTVYMNKEYLQRVQIIIAFKEQTAVVFIELSFYFLLLHILSLLISFKSGCR
jgi:hypothetical protein